MAIYRIFPENDTFIYTEDIQGNAGRDEVLELGGYPVAATGQTSRMLFKYNTTQIQNVVDSKIGSNPFQANLHVYLASAYEIPQSLTINAYPTYQSWVNGVGKFGDIPTDKSGVSWIYRTPQSTLDGAPSGSRWLLDHNLHNIISGSMPVGVTGSYNSTYEGGGGNWYTGSNGINLEATQVINLNDDADLNINITNAVVLHYSESIVNNGYIVKLSDDIEFNTTSSIRLKYYSSDTNTIYPPYLEFTWDDSVYETGSLSVLTVAESVINLTNNKGRYVDEGKQRFRLIARPKYPTRTFTTGSAYSVNYALPTTSYWGLRDEFTEEMIIPFSTGSTKISCDALGPYFDVYMDGLQPERYYRVLIKTEIDGSTVVVDNSDTFKVVRNG
jgi:hypothetical protein